MTKKSDKKKSSNPVGRPTDYSLETAILMCEKIATTHLSVAELCATDPNFPGCSQTFYRWFVHEKFSDMYERAKVKQAHVLADHMIQVINEKSEDNLNSFDRKLKIDTLKWHAARMMPRLYGDKFVIEDSSAKDKIIKKVKEKIQKAATRKRKEY